MASHMQELLTKRDAIDWSYGSILDSLNDGWIQGEYARRADGIAITPDHVEACSWCLSGAVLRTRDMIRTGKAPTSAYVREQAEMVYLDVRNGLVKAMDELFSASEAAIYAGLACFNDCEHRTLADVLRVVERARDAHRAVLPKCGSGG